MSGLLALPMTPAQCFDDIIVPTFQELLPGRYWSRPALWMLLSIAMQESDLEARRQKGGPAMGLWQCEQGGAVREVLTNEATRLEARLLCARRGVEPTEKFVYLALASDDLFACGIARLRLYADPAPLPRLGDTAGAAAYYHRTWRPGAWVRDPEGCEARFRRNAISAQKVVAP
jgi:hypothetical protein